MTVSLAPADESVEGLRPVIVSLGDRPPHTIELGGGYTSGGYPTNRASPRSPIDQRGAASTPSGSLQPACQADTITFTGRLAQIQQKLDAELDLPDWRQPDQTLKIGADIFADNTNAFDDDGLGLRAASSTTTPRTTFTG